MLVSVDMVAIDQYNTRVLSAFSVYIDMNKYTVDLRLINICPNNYASKYKLL